MSLVQPLRLTKEGPLERRLAAILAADVVGYSLFVAEAEEGTLRILNFTECSVTA